MRAIATVPALRLIRSYGRRVNGCGKLRAAGTLLAFVVSPTLSGCFIGTERPELNLEVPAAYRAAPARNADAAVPMLDWWRGFRSSELSSLMDAAQIYNLDIAVTVAQIIQADAQVGVSGAPLLPTVTGDASAERQKQSSANTISSGQGFGGTTFNTFQVGLTASFMLDFWGKNRATLCDDRGQCHHLAIVSGSGGVFLGGIERCAVLAPEIEHVARGQPDLECIEGRAADALAAGDGVGAALLLAFGAGISG